MSFLNSLQLGLSVVTSSIVAGAWWYIAFRLSYHWVLYALAFVSSLVVLLTVAFLGISMSGPMHTAPMMMQLFGLLGFARLVVSILLAILYVIFAAWITSRAKTPPPPPAA
jgi:hypothetical protein